MASIREWWRAEGRHLHPRTGILLITADSGGSNGYRLRIWKLKLQELADEAGLTVRVSHFPGHEQVGQGGAALTRDSTSWPPS